MIKEILVIEDDRFIGEMYVRSLKTANYNVDWVVDGNDGLVMALNKPYDLILVDIMLPEKRGNEIIEEFRKKSPNSKNTKVIFMTNFQHNSEEKENLLKIADGYFIKSEVMPRRLLEMIERL
ncbi:MAG: response regulator [bacterium]|nr:response regulator [bacterium]